MNPTASQAALATGRYNESLRIGFGLTFTYFLVEVVVGCWTNSLALLSDAVHMLTNVIGLALALFANWMSRRPITARRSYGFYRLEALAGQLNTHFKINHIALQTERTGPCTNSLTAH